jgi:hypothetical protein
VKTIVTWFFLSCLSLSVFGQTTYSLSGKVALAEGEQPVQGATVLLSESEGAAKEGLLTNQRGTFDFKELKPGTYALTISLAGFQTVTQEVTIVDASIRLPTIALAEKVYQVEEVVIEGQEAIAEQKGDTVAYNASAFKTNPDASAQDLIQKMPGMVMDNGQIKAQGEAIQQVLVDGKPFFGNDPSAALQNLPADVIQSIQVLDQQSDQAQFTGFQDGETTKTINIVTKPDKRVGRFGRAYAGYGYPDDLYQGGASVNMFNGDRRITLLGQSNNINQQNFAQEDLLGVSGGGGRRGRRGGGAGDFLVNNQGGITTTHAAGLNFSDEWGDKVEVSGSYFVNYSDNDALQDVSRNFLIEGDTGQVYQETSTSNRQNVNHRLNGRIEYKINAYNEIRIRPRLTLQQNQGTSLDSGQTIIGSNLANDFRNFRQTDLQAFSLSNRITYGHKFNDAGRSISIELDTDYDNDQGDNRLQSEINYYNDQGSPRDSTDQSSLTATNAWDIELEVEFNEPISSWGRLEIEYEYNPRYNDASTRTLAFDPNAERYNRLDTALSNVFTNTYVRHELGTGFRVNLKDETFVGNVTVGYQLARLDNDQTFPRELVTQTDFGGIVSRVYARYAISKERNLRLYYRGSIDPPSIRDLQNVLDNSNPLQLRAGNPNLQQSYDHFMVIRYSQTSTANSSNLYMAFRGSLTQNFVASSTYIAERDARVVNGITLQPGAQLTLPVNLNNRLDLNADLTYGRQIKKLKLNVNTDLSANYTRTPSLINEQANFSDNYRVGLGLTFSSNINEHIDFTLSSRGNLNQVVNSLREELNNQYYNQNSFARLNLIFWKGIVIRSQVSHQLFTGLSDGFNQSFWLWNGSLGKKLFRKQQGEIALSVFDLFGQNTSIQRNVTSTYIEDVRNVVLQRYFMLTFSYKFRHFTGGRGPDMDRGDGYPGRGRQ